MRLAASISFRFQLSFNYGRIAAKKQIAFFSLLQRRIVMPTLPDQTLAGSWLLGIVPQTTWKSNFPFNLLKNSAPFASAFALLIS